MSPAGAHASPPPSPSKLDRSPTRPRSNSGAKAHFGPRAVACIVGAAVLFVIAVVRASSFQPVVEEDLGRAVTRFKRRHGAEGPPEVFDRFFEAEDLAALGGACEPRNASWFARRERGILRFKDDRNGDYCRVNGTMGHYVHCPWPCGPAEPTRPVPCLARPRSRHTREL